MLITQKIDTPEYRSLLTPHLLKLVELFKANNYELRVAGGAVRDILIGIVPHDVDFATTATPQEMKDMFNKENIRLINSNGEQHGTITARIDDKENFEITTLRIDVATDGRHAVVQYTQNWELDANRRDLTINALFLGLDGTVYDYFNGLEDLRNRRIRFVGDAVQRIREDYLRILRYFRFFGRFAHDNAVHDEETLKAIRENVDGLKDIAGERLWVELQKMAEGRNAGPVLKTMFEQNVGKYLGIPLSADFNQLEEHWRQCYKAKPHAITILTKLFPNLDQIQQFDQRMKYSNECRRLAHVIITYRDSVSILQSSSSDPIKSYKDLLIDLTIQDPTAKEKIVELLKYQHHLTEAQLLSEWMLPRFPVTGVTLASKGIKQGPNYKIILDVLRKKWKESHYQATETQLIDENLPDILNNLSNASGTASQTNGKMSNGNSSILSPPKKNKTKI